MKIGIERKNQNPSRKRRASSDNRNPGVLAWASPRGSGIGRENVQHKRKQGEQTWQPGGKTKNKEPLPAEASTKWKAARACDSWRHEAGHRIDGPLVRTTRKHERQQMKSNYELDQDKMTSCSTSEKTGELDLDPRRRPAHWPLCSRGQMHSGNQVPAPSWLGKNKVFSWKLQQGTDLTGGSKRKVLSSGRKTATQL
jgi:hypothetical protein